jgi:hypothetical protein
MPFLWNFVNNISVLGKIKAQPERRSGKNLDKK